MRRCEIIKVLLSTVVRTVALPNPAVFRLKEMDYELEPTTQDHSRQVQWLRGTSDAIGVLPWTYGMVNSLQYGRSDEYKGVHKDMVIFFVLLGSSKFHS